LQTTELEKQKNWSALQIIEHLLDLELEAREKIGSHCDLTNQNSLKNQPSTNLTSISMLPEKNKKIEALTLWTWSLFNRKRTSF
jgi:hypothetical protein